MRISFLWILSKKKKDNKKSLQMLEKQLKGATEKHEIILCTNGFDVDKESNQEFVAAAKALPAEVTVMVTESKPVVAIYGEAVKKATGEYLTMIYSGDIYSDGYIAGVEKVDTKGYGLLMTAKYTPDEKKLAFARPILDDNGNILRAKEGITLDFSEDCSVQPMYLGGSFVRKDVFEKCVFDTEDGMDAERKLFMDLCVKEGNLLFLHELEYITDVAREGNVSLYTPVFDRAWYTDVITDFWIPYIKSFGEKIPTLVQVNALYSMKCRLMANKDNQNKHILEDDEIDDCLQRIGDVLRLLDDEVIMNIRKVKEVKVESGLRWIFGYLKYGEEFKLSLMEIETEDGEIHKATSYKGVPVSDLDKSKVNIQFMDYGDHKLHIDGTIPFVTKMLSESMELVCGEESYPLNFNGRYGLTKFFGRSLYKKFAFSVDIPIPEKFSSKAKMYVQVSVAGERIRLQTAYNSHYSRLTKTYQNSYWCFGPKKKYMALTSGDNEITLKNTNWFGRFGKELKVLGELMFVNRQARDFLFVGIRTAFHILKPFMKFGGKKIWLYFDKIYKGGDSSEYLYKYAVAQKDPKIKHYYLVDKNSTDYQRLKDEGYEPLVRKSIKHRLVFMMADMMVISNSTSYAFNNFGIINSSYVRDLIDSHACCVQHGMSVQKIAIAQNRLRDNTRLYFCASQYEIKNLSKPVYDYVGYDALKLTGVPRYDGLVDRSDKQIMISPTWRMQAAVKVQTSEGEARGYNPLFKQTDYYRVYNALINNPRLLEAAREYGYKIKYVLHPIVSVQAKDFDKNDVVEIIPAIGDMSYEDMFCESSLMVTDFSGIQFDFAYMRKPVLYLHHDDIPQHYEEGTFFYDTMAFGEIAHNNDELIDYLIDYMKHDCVMKDEYVRRVDDFFYFNDHNNCERIYKEMIQYQKEHIA